MSRSAWSVRMMHCATPSMERLNGCETTARSIGYTGATGSYCRRRNSQLFRARVLFNPSSRSHWPERRSFRMSLRRRLLPRLLGLVQLELFRDRLGDRGPLTQAFVIGLHVRPFGELDRRRRHGPVDDRDEIGVGDAELVE